MQLNATAVHIMTRSFSFTIKIVNSPFELIKTCKLKYKY